MPLDRGEGSVRKREYVAPEVHLDGTSETVDVCIGDTHVSGRWPKGRVVPREVEWWVLADAYVVGQSCSVKGSKRVGGCRVVVEEGDNPVCDPGGGERPNCSYKRSRAS